LADTVGIEGGKGYPAAERIDLRHAVQHDHRARRGIAAQPAQCRALAGGVRRARIRAPELPEACDIAQHVLKPVARGRRQPRTVDRDDVISGIAGDTAKAFPGDDDFGGRFGGQGDGHCASLAGHACLWSENAPP